MLRARRFGLLQKETSRALALVLAKNPGCPIRVDAVYIQVVFASMKARSVRRNQTIRTLGLFSNRYTSTFAYFAFASMKARRGGTSSPINMEKTRSASRASSMVTR